MKKASWFFLIPVIVIGSSLTLSAQVKPLGDTVPTATPDPNVKVVRQPRTPGGVSANSETTDISVQACSNLVADPSFEAYTPNPSWYEYSLLYGTPLCNTTDCNTVSAGPRTGTAWAWFGGAPSSFDELGVISQTVTIPADTASLSFYLRIQSFSGGADDYLQVFIDNTEVFSVTALNAGSYSTYQLVGVNASPFANGAAHSLQFWSETFDQTVNFHVDDLYLCSFVATSKIYLPTLRR